MSACYVRVLYTYVICRLIFFTIIQQNIKFLTISNELSRCLFLIHFCVVFRSFAFATGLQGIFYVQVHNANIGLMQNADIDVEYILLFRHNIALLCRKFCVDLRCFGNFCRTFFKKCSSVYNGTKHVAHRLRFDRAVAEFQRAFFRDTVYSDIKWRCVIH